MTLPPCVSNLRLRPSQSNVLVLVMCVVVTSAYISLPVPRMCECLEQDKH